MRKTRSNLIDETGNVYGSLTVLYPVRPEGARKTLWHCKCKCGKEVDFNGSELRAGKRTSCGKHCNSIALEEVGTQYGYLTILKQDSRPAKSFADNCIHQICKCSLCGSIKSISGRTLRNGTTIACGCAESLGEQAIGTALNNLQLQQEREYSYPDLIGKKKPLRFDFKVYIPNSNLQFLIEFQGIQHFKEIDYFKHYQEQRLENDNKKLQYCKEHKINILYINQKNSRKFNGNQIDFEKIILDFIKQIQKGETEYEIFNYNY